MSTVGVVVNPWAGKDVRRLHAATGHTPDTAKVGIVRRVLLGALDAGVDRVLVAADVGRIAERAVAGIAAAQVVDGPSTGSALDTRRAAAQFAELGCGVVVVLGGDGTCRDVVIGWPEVTMVAISTGTNNVFPSFVDGSSAGAAAGLVASGRIDVADVRWRAKRLVARVTGGGEPEPEDIALVDVALIDAQHAGARAVVRAGSVRAVVAVIASPASTGLSSIAGRVRPMDRNEDGAVVVRTDVDGGGRRLRVPIVPGSFDEIGVSGFEQLALGEQAVFAGPAVLAFDGERERVLRGEHMVTIHADRNGPWVVDVERTLGLAATRRLFDVVSSGEGNADGD